ncbi:MAG: hypothetical protein BGO01_20930 [Armatimonadetes bacterium 55-13]|nr:DUF1800 domain-containing protein [Armatimonadota bacterium]ODU54157.1 MAG: hypothetical protein ABT09_00035 [bacterium SCN 57-13]OJU64576.1 MAG: hypothetical protein BGO01_20930 [Armatimonadetes bacterium 55-13]
MKLSRRQVLGLGAATAGVVVTGCAPFARRLAADLPEDVSLPKGDVESTLRLVNRVSYGPTPGELARVKAMGRGAYLEEQLNPTDEEPLALMVQLQRLDAYRMDAAEMEELPIDLVLMQLQQGVLLRATYSPHQLRERMVEFWSDHLNIYARKGSSAFRKGTDDLNVIRKHALGSFHDLISASAHSPAMLAYLDNQVNVKGVANENYARELMELHTLGVHGGYSQKDVQEVARCFTGWGIENRFLRPKGKFVFDPEKHDDGEKVVLGHRIPAGGGESDGEQVLTILANHPNTAKFVCSKLCKRFLGHTDEAVVDGAAKVFLEKQGDTRAVLKFIFSDENIDQSRPVQKRPFDYVVSALRATGAQSDCGRPIQEHLEKMGMAVYQWPMPDGYPVKPEAWTGTLLARWNFAAALAKNEIGGTSVDLEKIGERSQDFAAALMGTPKVDSIKHVASELPTMAAACLASPEFQWR